MTVGDNYIFSTGESAAPRLILLERIYGTMTNALLMDSGLRQGMNVVEIGCGVGFTACHLAKVVGPTGRVFAIDISSDQLKVARSNAARENLENIEFIEASATNTCLPLESIDLVFSRLVLSHIRQVDEAIIEFRRLLKPDGVLVCEDLIASQVFSVPETAVYSRLRELANQFAAKQGVDYSIGDRLPQLIQKAGFKVDFVRRIQPAFFVGEEKRWWEYSIREATPMLLQSGFMDDGQVDGLLKALEAVALNPEVMVAQPVMTQVSARR